MLRCWVLAMSLAACGPIAYVNQVTRSAATSVEAAKAVEAEKFAPYWWTRATEYLHKARERAARADFQGANRFGKLATDAAQQAVVDAEAAKGNPDLLPIDATGKTPPPAATPKTDIPIAPAKDEP
jgi:hypothetical protein